jgi:hypothetical protein
VRLHQDGGPEVLAFEEAPDETRSLKPERVWV